MTSSLNQIHTDSTITPKFGDSERVESVHDTIGTTSLLGLSGN